MPKNGGPQKDTNGTWSFVVDIGLDPATGKRRQARRRGFTTKRTAQEEFDRLRVVAYDKLYVAPSKQTLAEYLQTWLTALPASGLRPSTVDGYRRNLESYSRDDSVTPRPRSRRTATATSSRTPDLTPRRGSRRWSSATTSDPLGVASCALVPGAVESS